MDTTINDNWVHHPGEFIKEEIDERGWSQRDLAFILGCPEQAINMLVSWKRGISPEMAKELGDAFGVPADHAVRINSGGTQLTFWADIDSAKRSHMEKAFAQRRRQVAAGNALVCRCRASIDHGARGSNRLSGGF